MTGDGYMQDPQMLSDEIILIWVKSFHDQPPTMDYMGEWSWANAMLREANRRGLEYSDVLGS